MENTEERISWRETFKQNNRAFKLFYKKYPQMLMLNW